MAARRKPDPDGITTAQLAGTAGRYVSRKPLDVEAAVAELREIAGGRADLCSVRWPGAPSVSGLVWVPGWGLAMGRRGRGLKASLPIAPADVTCPIPLDP
jgi:hypothetical protein